ncbi:MAG: HlyD family secretion protein [Pseudomonadales bacterium]|nr:HlyD family secretion protein [Pseudomonadales bacterium]
MKPDKRKLAIFAIVLGTVLTGAGLFTWHWYETGRFIEETDDGYVKADVIDVRPEITGRIQRVAVKENQQVRAGDLLVELDSSDFEAQVRQATSQVKVQEAGIKQVEEELSLQHQNVERAKASIVAAKAEAERASLALDRAKALNEQSYGSRQDLETAQANATVAKASVAEAEAGLLAEKQQLTVIRARQSSASANLDAARANLDLAKVRLAKTRIVAKRNGVVGDITAHAGAMASPGVVLMRVVPVSEVYVAANFKETQISAMSIGQTATIHVDAFPDVTFHGTIESLAPATGSAFSLLPQDNATGNFNKIVQRVPVRIRIDEPAAGIGRLRPGLSVVTQVDTRTTGTGLSYQARPRGSDHAGTADD